jgi:hypothetical protein
MAFAITIITLGGFGILFGTVIGALGILTDGPNGAHTSPRELIPIVVPMIVFGTATLALVDFMLIKLFSRLMNLPAEPVRPSKQKAVSASGYRSSHNTLPPQQISAPPISMPSVTEHTTRNFDPIPSMEQKARE